MSLAVESAITANPVVCNYDITFPHTEQVGGEVQWEHINDWAKHLFKKYVFQLERGEKTERLHYQFRGSLKKKTTLRNMIHLTHNCFPSAHVSITSKHCIGDFSYVSKSETRVDGPWGNAVPKEIKEEQATGYYVPSRFLKAPVWNEFQRDVLNIVTQPPDDRKVICIYGAGCQGKSFLALFLHAHKKALYVPQFETAKELMRMCYGLPKRGIYFIDLPRATSQNGEHALYSGIEQLKNGYIYEDRYNYKSTLIEPPHVVVFSNKKPNTELLSADRWTILKLKDKKLIAPPGEDIVIPVGEPDLSKIRVLSMPNEGVPTDEEIIAAGLDPEGDISDSEEDDELSDDEFIYMLPDDFPRRFAEYNSIMPQGHQLTVKEYAEIYRDEDAKIIEEMPDDFLNDFHEHCETRDDKPSIKEYVKIYLGKEDKQGIDKLSDIPPECFIAWRQFNHTRPADSQVGLIPFYEQWETHKQYLPKPKSALKPKPKAKPASHRRRVFDPEHPPEDY